MRRRDPAQRLLGLAERLATTTGTVDAAHTLTSVATRAFEADAGLAWLREGDHYRLVATHGYDGPRTDPYARIPASVDLPLARAIRDTRVVTVESRDDLLATYPYLGRTGPVHHEAWAVVPFLAGECVVGGLVLCFEQPRTFDEHDQRMLVAIGGHARLAFERARLFEDLATVARASVELSRSLDYDTTVATALDLLHPQLADFAFFDLVRDGQVDRIARAWDDPRRQAMLDATSWARSEHPELNLCALSTGQTAYHPQVDDGWMQRAAFNPQHLAALRDLGFCSMVSVPLHQGEQRVGALTLFYADTERHHCPADVALAEEIARRTALALQNARLYDEARRANHANEQFLAVLGHELRNPLASIVAALDLVDVRGGGATEPERRILDGQLSHLVRLVDDLLDVARISQGKVELRRRAVSLDEVVANALDITGTAIEERGHTLTWQRFDGPCTVDGDPERLTQVVVNLLTNAARYTPRGGTLEIFGAVSGGRAALRVRDDGIGLSPELIERIFDPFSQGQGPGAGGLGLGLSIAHRLVALHDGTLTAESDGEGLGSTFTVLLPLSGRPADAARTAEPPSAPPPPRRVLIVDDNHHAAALVGEYLELRGHDVRVCFDPNDALALVEAFVPDVALLDIGLPSMDGYELAARLRELPALQGVRLIAITGYGSAADRERALQSGFDQHLVKPVALRTLLRSL